MSAKVNRALDDEVKAALDDLIPIEERSRFDNEALQAESTLVGRRQAIEELEALRQAGPHVLTTDILVSLRESREAE